MKYIYFYLIVLILLSCESIKESDNFGNEIICCEEEIIEIDGKLILKDEFNAISLDLIDSVLMVNLNNDSFSYRLYNTKNMELIKPFGKIGEGPNEWGSARFGGQVLEVGEKKVLVINDGFKYIVRLFDLTTFLQKDTVIYYDEFKLHPKYSLTQEIFKISKNKYLGVPGIDAIKRGRLKIFDKSKKEEYTTELFPKINDQNLTSYEIYINYLSSLRKHPSKNLIASSMFRFNRIDVFDVEGNVQFSIVGNVKDLITNSKNLKTPNGALIDLPNYYIDLKVTEDRIYGLFYDQPNSEYGKKLIPTFIRVFDWNGKYIMTYKIKDYLMSFAIDEKMGKIYGVDYFNQKIIEYDLLENE